MAIIFARTHGWTNRQKNSAHVMIVHIDDDDLAFVRLCASSFKIGLQLFSINKNRTKSKISEKSENQKVGPVA